MWTPGSSFHPTASTRDEGEVCSFAIARDATLIIAGGSNDIRALFPGLSLSKRVDPPTDSLSSKDAGLSQPGFQKLMTAGSQVELWDTD